MDESVPTTTMPNDSSPPAQAWVIGRALLSAVVFGFIGQWLGQKLGQHIKNKVTEPTLKWSIGAFWALLAAHCSLKASAMERGLDPSEVPAQDVSAARKDLVALIEPKTKMPLSLVEVDTLKADGPLQEAPELQRM